ncbi:MAG: DUF2892 domain-containing protein [Actinomycetota bacterium]|nr:DUF2892 domain-containing protein [Actinomycetota bacterium]
MKNEASWDRVVRVVGGVVLIGLGLGGVIASPWGWVAAAVGGVFLATGIVGFCPIYAVLRLRTNGDEVGS